jgi:hypothetical protein
VDQSKAEKLRDIGYVKHNACGSCVHSTFASPTVQFGECSLHSYEHRKHTGGQRPLSILRHGGCEDHEVRVDYEQQTDHFVF